MADRNRSRTTARQYPRTARLNELLREIVADELERLDDERLELVTVTAVNVEPDLRHATVLFTTLSGEDADATVLEGFGEARVRLQAAIARQTRTKRVPHLTFRVDAVGRQAQRIEDILRSLPPPASDDQP